jgi:solute carrier family 25, member 39/40
LTHPFDVAKTRRQASDHFVNSPSTVEIIREIHQREGLAGLMKGLSPRLAKIGPACAIMIGAYEGLGGILAERDEKNQNHRV